MHDHLLQQLSMLVDLTSTRHIFFRYREMDQVHLNDTHEAYG